LVPRINPKEMKNVDVSLCGCWRCVGDLNNQDAMQ